MGRGGALGGAFWLLEAAYATPGNTAVKLLLGNTGNYQFKWVPECSIASLSLNASCLATWLYVSADPMVLEMSMGVKDAVWSLR